MQVNLYNKVILITDQGDFVVNPSMFTDNIDVDDIIAYDERDWGGGIQHFRVHNIVVVSNNLRLVCKPIWIKGVYPSSEKVED